MAGKTHVICGTITMLAVTATYFGGLQFGDYTYLPAIGLLAVMTGSHMPNIDVHCSKLGQQHKFISKHLIHRGITHMLLIPTILFVVILMTTIARIPVLLDLILGFNVGWTIHVIADLCNYKDVPFFWPFYRRGVHIVTFLTLSWQEYVFIFLWLGVSVACVFFLLR